MSLAPKQLGKVSLQADFPAGTNSLVSVGAIELYRAIVMAQVTIGATVVFPAPSDPSVILSINLVNSGTESISISAAGAVFSIPAKSTKILIWAGTQWTMVAGQSTYSTQTTSVVAVGAVGDTMVMPLDTNLLYVGNQQVIAYQSSSDYIIGRVISYTSSTGSMSVEITEIHGQPNTTTWFVDLAGAGSRFQEFIPGADVTKGEPVRLHADGHVYPTGYVEPVKTMASSFGLGASDPVYKLLYVPTTNQLVAVGFTVSKPVYYVGNINLSTKVVTWTATSIQLSVNNANYITAVYNATQDKIVVMYADAGNSGKASANVITRSGLTWTASAAIQNLTTDTGVINNTLYASGNDIFLSYYSGSTKIRKYALSGSTVTLTSTSPTMPGSVSSMVEYSATKFIVATFSGTNLNMYMYDHSANTLSVATSVAALTAVNNLAVVYENSNWYAIYLSNAVGGYVNGTTNGTTFTYIAANVLHATGSVSINLYQQLSNRVEVIYFNGVQYISYRVTCEAGVVTKTVASAYVNSGVYAITQQDVDTYWVVYFLFNTNPTLRVYSEYNLYYNTDPVIGIIQKTALNGVRTPVAIDKEISFANTSLIPGTKYYWYNSAISTNANGTLLGQALSSSSLLVDMSAANVVSYAITGSVLDDTIADPTLVTVAGRYVVPSTGTTGVFAGNENKYADYDGSAFSFTVPTANDTVNIVGGTHAGQLTKYSAGTWTSINGSQLKLTNWVQTAAYASSDLTIKGQALYQANGAITAGTPFAVGTTGATFQQIGVSGSAEYGELVLTGGYLPITAAANTWQDFGTFVLPTAGVWEINTHIVGDTAASSNITSGLRVSGVLIANSEVNCGYFGAGSGDSTGSNTIRYTTTGATTITLSVMRSAAVTGNVRTDAAGRSSVKWKKIASWLPVIGQQVDYGYYYVGTIPATAPTIIPLTNKSGNLTASSNLVTLTAGKTYRLAAYLGIRCGYYTYAWTNSSGVQLPNSNQGFAAAVNSGDSGCYAPAVAYITPTTNMTVKLMSVLTNNVDPAQVANWDITCSAIEVVQIGSSNMVGAPRSAATLGTDASGSFIVGSPLLGAWSADSTLTINATTTGPGKATTKIKDRIASRQKGTKEYEVAFQYSHTNSAGTSNGTGEYLFSLPNGLSFDLTKHGTFTTVGSTDQDGTLLGLALLDSVAYVASANFNAVAIVIPYNATQFRLYCFKGDSEGLAVGSPQFGLTSGTLSYNGKFTFFSA